MLSTYICTGRCVASGFFWPSLVPSGKQNAGAIEVLAPMLARPVPIAGGSLQHYYGPLGPPWTCMGMIFGTRPQPSPMSSKCSDDFRKMDPCKSKANLKHIWNTFEIHLKWIWAFPFWILCCCIPNADFCVVQPCRVLVFQEKHVPGVFAAWNSVSFILLRQYSTGLG